MYAPVQKILKITRSSFWSEIFTQQALYNFQPFIRFEFLIWVTEVPQKIWVSQTVLFSQISALYLHLLLLRALFLVLWGKNLNKVGEQYLMFNLSVPMCSNSTQVKLYYYLALTALIKFMRSFVWRKFSSVTKEDDERRSRSAKSLSLGMPPAPPRNIQGDSSV